MNIFKKRKNNVSLESNSQTKPATNSIVFSNINDNLNFIKNALNHTVDFKTQQIINSDVLIAYIETIVDKQIIQQKIIDPLFQKIMQSNEIVDSIQTVIHFEMKQVSILSEAIEDLINGNTLLLLNKFPFILSIETQSTEKRSITEPTSEKIVRGAHDGFIEDLSTNINLIRKQIKNPNLTVRNFILGKTIKTKVSLIYIKNLTNSDLLHKIEKRIKAISIDSAVPSSYLEEYIQDSKLSPFPQILNTERPDRVIGNLSEGRAILLEENNPNALILPVTFFAFYQSPDDYNSRWGVGSFFRFLRILSFFIAVGLPALYISVISFHFEVLPNELITPIKSSIQGIPYPPIIEALIMELTIELIREAGIRLPTTISQTIGIVGGLVIGDAVVKIGLISNAMIIVVALTAIASFVVPSSEMSNSVRLLRFPFMVAAATGGFIGMAFTFMILVTHLCKLESFGIPYFAPLAPFNFKGLKDSIIRAPAWKLDKNPSGIQPKKQSQQSYAKKGEQNDDN
ncbi:TPA: spore germination protein [Bacillus thuringiensis]|nr:spore germination protein [Bacillus thuringiensis]